TGASTSGRGRSSRSWARWRGTGRCSHGGSGTASSSSAFWRHGEWAPRPEPSPGLLRSFALPARGRVLRAPATPESVAQAGSGSGEVRVDLQSPLVVFDRLTEPALLSERIAPVVVGFGQVRLDAQGLPEVLDRFGRFTLKSEHQAQIVSGEGRVGVNGKGVGPERRRVTPDLGLVPCENSQPDDDT